MISRKTLSSRFVQLAVNGCTVITGFCTFLPLGYTSKYFPQCILYADLSVRTTTVDGNTTVVVDVQKSTWGSNCNFATFVPVVAAVHAFIWCWFFLLMKATLKEDKREYYLLVPSFFLHSIMFLVVFVSSSLVSAGADTFCRNLSRSLGPQYSCSESFNLYWSIFRGKKHGIHRFLLISKVFSWLMTLTILTQCVLTVYKLYIWFVLQENSPKKSKSSQSLQSLQWTDGSNNHGYTKDSDSEISLDIDDLNRANVFTHHDETGSLIRVL